MQASAVVRTHLPKALSIVKRLLRLVATLFSVAVLTACSTGTDTSPTMVPSIPAPAPTISPGGTSVGSIIDGVNTAWNSVQSVQTTFWSTSTEGVADSPPTAGEVTIDLAIAPDRRHVTRLIDGEAVEEQIGVGGRVFMRGAIVVAAIAPMVGTDTWVEVDPRGADPGSAAAAQIAWLLSPFESPFQRVSEETRGLEAFPGEAIEIGGRLCRTWRFGDVNGIQQELAVDEAGLPCRLVQRAGTYANVTTYQVNLPSATITPPAVASPTAP
jgi:hypothetical protein